MARNSTTPPNGGPAASSSARRHANKPAWMRIVTPSPDRPGRETEGRGCQGQSVLPETVAIAHFEVFDTTDESQAIIAWTILYFYFNRLSDIRSCFAGIFTEMLWQVHPPMRPVHPHHAASHPGSFHWLPALPAICEPARGQAYEVLGARWLVRLISSACPSIFQILTGGCNTGKECGLGAGHVCLVQPPPHPCGSQHAWLR